MGWKASSLLLSYLSYYLLNCVFVVSSWRMDSKADNDTSIFCISIDVSKYAFFIF